MKYELYAVRVFVTDWQRALEFYSQTLEIPVAFSSAEQGWAELQTGAARLALERVDHEDPESAGLVGRFVAVSLQVADVQSTYQQLVSRGVEFVAPPERQPWGGVLAHFRDPDGNVLTLLGT